MYFIQSWHSSSVSTSILWNSDDKLIHLGFLIFASACVTAILLGKTLLKVSKSYIIQLLTIQVLSLSHWQMPYTISTSIRDSSRKCHQVSNLLLCDILLVYFYVTNVFIIFFRECHIFDTIDQTDFQVMWNAVSAPTVGCQFVRSWGTLFAKVPKWN